MNGAERDTVVGSGSLVTLDPGATKREIARSFPVQTRGHYRRREALDPQRQQRGRQASEAARHKRKGVISAEAAHRARRETGERAADLMGGEDLGEGRWSGTPRR